MAKSIRERVNRAFNDNSHDDITQYLEWLRSAIADCMQNLRRTVYIMLLLAAAFELVSSSPGTKLTVGSFQVAKDSIVLQAIPPLVAYLYFQSTVYAQSLHSMRQAFSLAFKRWSLAADANDLDAFLFAPMPLHWNVAGGSERPVNAPLVRRVEGIAVGILGPLISLGVWVFEAQAYYKLFSVPRPSLVPLIAGVCIVALCFVARSRYGLVVMIQTRQVLLQSPEAAERMPRISRLLQVPLKADSSRVPRTRRRGAARKTPTGSQAPGT
jgi:hypothetical protein